MIKVKFFAGIAEKINKQEIVLKQQEMTVGGLRQWLIAEYPALEDDVNRAMIAVNEEFAEEETKISKVDVVALIPPVSGG